MQTLIDLFTSLINLMKEISPYIFALLSGYMGYRYGLDQFSKQKKLEFVERQIREFYSPMIGCLMQIQAKSNLRYEISKASDLAWKKLVEQHPKPFEDHEKYFEPFKQSILYDNDQLRNELIPLYDKMVKIFSDNYWLAEPETRKWYSELSEFVDLWHRWLDEKIHQK